MRRHAARLGKHTGSKGTSYTVEWWNPKVSRLETSFFYAKFQEVSINQIQAIRMNPVS